MALFRRVSFPVPVAPQGLLRLCAPPTRLPRVHLSSMAAVGVSPTTRRLHAHAQCVRRSAPWCSTLPRPSAASVSDGRWAVHTLPSRPLSTHPQFPGGAPSPADWGRVALRTAGAVVVGGVVFVIGGTALVLAAPVVLGLGVYTYLRHVKGHGARPGPGAGSPAGGLFHTRSGGPTAPSGPANPGGGLLGALLGSAVRSTAQAFGTQAAVSAACHDVILRRVREASSLGHVVQAPFNVHPAVQVQNTYDGRLLRLHMVLPVQSVGGVATEAPSAVHVSAHLSMQGDDSSDPDVVEQALVFERVAVVQGSGDVYDITNDFERGPSRGGSGDSRVIDAEFTPRN